jgi:hypothetical protein
MNASLYVTNCTDLPIGCQQHVPALLEHLQKLQETRLINAINVFKNNSWIPYAKYVWALFPRARQKGIIQNEWRETRLKTKGWNVIRRQVLPWEIWSCLLNELRAFICVQSCCWLLVLLQPAGHNAGCLCQSTAVAAYPVHRHRCCIASST